MHGTKSKEENKNKLMKNEEIVQSFKTKHYLILSKLVMELMKIF